LTGTVRFLITLALVVAQGVAIAAPAVSVEGDSLCPTPAEVAALVAPLLADGVPAPAPARARVDQAGAELRVRLSDELGAPVAERQLASTGSCPETAEFVAVMIATWLGQLRPEQLPTLRLPSPPAASAPPVRSVTVGELGAGVGVTLADGSAAPGARALVSLSARTRGWGVVAQTSLTTGHEVTIGAHAATWRRWHVTVGPSYRVPVGRWRLTASAGLSAGWISAEGTTFPRNFSTTGFSPGAGGLIQLARPFGTWSPWFAIGAAAAFHDRPLTVSDSTDQRALRPFELDISVGASMRWLP
jgi:hypothetical protein